MVRVRYRVRPLQSLGSVCFYIFEWGGTWKGPSCSEKDKRPVMIISGCLVYRAYVSGELYHRSVYGTELFPKYVFKNAFL